MLCYLAAAPDAQDNLDEEVNERTSLVPRNNGERATLKRPGLVSSPIIAIIAAAIIAPVGDMNTHI